MAFNPFTSFRKYQKFWMATVLLLCMVTFVLCTGVGGDLTDRLLRWFAPRHGSSMAKLDGRTLYSDELHAIKTQRKVADRFVRLSIETVLMRIKGQLEQDKEPKGKLAQQRRAMEARLGGIEAELKSRLLKPHYFEGDSKLDSIVDFMLWLRRADELDVHLTPQSVTEMLYREIFAVIPFGQDSRAFFEPRDESRIFYDLRREFSGLNSGTIYQALSDEYRVRIAQLATYQAQPNAYRHRFSQNKAELREIQFLKVKYPEETRAPLSPAQLWDIFKEKRTLYDLSLVPVRVEAFRGQIKDPDADKLKSFFEAGKNVPYDPTSPKSGFEIPQMVKLAWIMADPASPAYQGSAHAVTLLERTPPIAWLGPFDPLVNAVLYGASPLAWDASMQINYDKFRRVEKYQIGSLTESALPGLLNYLGKPEPKAVAAAVAVGFSDPLAIIPTYQSQIWIPVQSELDKLLAIENKPRSLLAASVIGLAEPAPFYAIASWLGAERTPRVLPLEAVNDEFSKLREKVLAESWTNANMLVAKDNLDEISGKERAIQIKVPQLIDQYALRHGVTEKFYNKFDIGSGPELADLRQEFEKQREKINITLGAGGTPEMLKEGDFYKLFFESADAGSGRYVIRPWPPVLEVKQSLDPGAGTKKESFFNTAGKPILFWKTDEKHAQSPETIDAVKDLVLSSWKAEKAREDLALPRAKEIAQALLKSGGDFQPVIRDEAKKLNISPIAVYGLAVLDPDRVADLQGLGQSTHYRDYQLPKDMFEYPREDMIKQLLALTNLQKPIQSDYKPLDDLNKELFEITKKLPEKERAGRYVQVLTNKPHSVFWVGAVTGVPGANIAEFAEAYKHAASFPVDTFVTVAQEDAGKQYQEAILQQLRRQFGREITADESARKSFDTGD